MKTICDDNGDTEVNYTYDLNNRLLEESNHSYANNKTDVTKYVYDNNGNQIKKIGYITKGVNGSPSQDLVSENELNNTYEMYKYNEFNEMTSFESNKEAVWYYAYLPNGLRYRKHKNNYNNSDWFVWDRNGNIIAEMNGEGNLTSKYVRGNKLISKDGNEYFGYDGHGSVVNISNESGKSIKSYDYDAFGVELNKDANDTNLFRYCGEQYDNETDSIYLRARYYSPSLGRFTTEDTYWNSSNRIYGDKEYKKGEIKYPDFKAIMQDSNLYSYCINNSIAMIDSTGTKAKILKKCKNSKDNYYSYEDSIGPHKVEYKNYKTVKIDNATEAIQMEDEITRIHDYSGFNIIPDILLNIIDEKKGSNLGGLFGYGSELSGNRIQDENGRSLHIESGYNVRVTTIRYSTKRVSYVEMRYKIFNKAGKEVFNDSYLSGISD